MLREAGIFPDDAKRFAEAVPFEALREHIFTWRKDARATGPGALKHRIDNDFSRFTLTDEDRATAFYIRFRTPEEEYASEVAEEEEEPTPAPAPQTATLAAVNQAVCTNSEHHRIWLKILDDYEMLLPKRPFNDFMRNTVPLSTEGLDYVIACHSAAGAEWLKTRLAAKIQRNLGFIAQQPVTLEFRVLEVAHERI